MGRFAGQVIGQDCVKIRCQRRKENGIFARRGMICLGARTPYIAIESGAHISKDQAAAATTRVLIITFIYSAAADSAAAAASAAETGLCGW